MASFPYMPFYTSAYWSDTSHLTYEEHGVYLRLIMVYWEKGKPLPSDPAKLARILGISLRRFERLWKNLEGFFSDDGETISHARIEIELEKVRAKSLKAKQSALANAHRTKSDRSTDVQRPQSERQADVQRTPSYIDRDIDIDISTDVEIGEVAISPAPRFDLNEAVRAWNEMAGRIGLAQVQRVTEPRRRALKARLAECDGIDGWYAALARVEASPFLTGGNDRGWRADFDFVVRESSFTKIMEGKYDRADQKSAAQRAFESLFPGGGSEASDSPFQPFSVGKI